MMKTFSDKYIVFVILFCLFISKEGVAQIQKLAQYTQYMNNELMLNPAYSGMDEVLSTSLSYRSQWNGLDGAPTSQNFSIHSLLKSKTSGVGLVIYRDQIGGQTQINAKGTFAYRIKIDDKKVFAFGASLGMNHHNFGFTNLEGRAKDIQDPLFTSSGNARTTMTGGVGVFYKSDRLSFGISNPNLIGEQNIITQSVGPVKQFFIFGAYMIPLNYNLDLEPSFLIKTFENTPISWDSNISLVYNKVMKFGIGYRSIGEISFLTNLRITPQLYFSYTYDKPLNSAVFPIVSHEVMVKYLFKFSRNNVHDYR